MSDPLTPAPMDPGDVKPKHLVFLCHSGAQKGFVEQLDKDLRSADRYPFFDKDRDSLPIAENFPDLIFKAIKQCQVGVVILSEELFMRSHWPMFEVAKMIECGRNIMPVFLDISPKDLSNVEKLERWKSQWEGWKESNKRIDILKWEEALKALKSLKALNGLVYNAAAGEVKFREEIVKEICKMVPPFHRWDDSHVQGKSRLSKKIAETTVDGVRVVGLYGVGGIGKTTACKSLCNDVLMEFGERVCHVEFGSGTSLERVQEVLRRLTSTSSEFLKQTNLDEEMCWSRLKALMPTNKVFLAIDNVSSDSKVSEEARKYLKLKYFQGSVVMVTARGLEQLIGVGVERARCLAMPELVEDEARDLFLYYAELSGNVVDEGVVRCCIQRCYFGKGGGKGGHYHPLALKVLGSHMVGRDPGEWKSQLEDVEDVFNQQREREHPVFSILRRSFDELKDEDKALFMDVALIRVEYDYGFYYQLFQLLTHRRSDFYDSRREWLSIVHGLNMKKLKERLNGLKKRALLDEVGGGTNEIEMHDLWREFAVEETHRVERDGRRSWVYEVGNREGENSCLFGGGWKELRRIICIKDARAGYRRGRLRVKCLEFRDCSNVTVLRLMGVDVDNQEVDLSPLTHLKSLEIRGVDSKVSGIGQLRNLAVLLWSLVCISSLQACEEIWCLRNLQVLHLQLSCGFARCTSLDLDMLTLLRELKLGLSFSNVTMSGLSSRLSKLRILDICGYESIWSCPGVGDVVGLEVLLLQGCSNLEELPNLERLAKLRILDISSCKLLKAVPGLGSLVALQEFCAPCCRKLAELPDVSRLTNLEVLDLGWCESLKRTPPGFGNLVALHTCQIPGAFLSNWPNLRKLTKFDEVVLSYTPTNRAQGICRIYAKAGFGEGSRLCWNLEGLNVSTLHLRTVRQDFGLANFSTLTALKRLKIDNCRLVRLPDMGKDMTLESLTISQCGRLTGWNGVGRLGRPESETGEVYGHCNWTLPKLQELRWWHSGVVELPDLSHMPRLRRLAVNHDCRRALYRGWPYFAVQLRVDHMHLETLILRSSPISDLPDLMKFSGLKVLKIQHCHNLTSLTCSGPLVSLQSLSLRHCRCLVDIPSFDLFLGLHSVLVWESRGVVLNEQAVEDLKKSCSYLSVPGARVGRVGYFESDSKDLESDDDPTDETESEWSFNSASDSDIDDWGSDGGFIDSSGSASEPSREPHSLSTESESDGHQSMQFALEGPTQLHDAGPSSVQEEASCSTQFVPHAESITESVPKRELEVPSRGEVEEGQLKKLKHLQ